MRPLAPSEYPRRLRVPGYLILGSAMVLPLLDFVLSVMPMRPDTVAWRFGAIGLFASAQMVPLLTMFLIYALALMAKDRRVIIFIGGVSFLLALTALVSSGAFALDALQMNGRVQPQAYARFRLASVQAVAKLILGGVAALVLSVSVFRTARAMRLATVRNKGEAFLMGRPLVPRAESAAAPAPSEG
jgi:hypothetical protein